MAEFHASGLFASLPHVFGRYELLQEIGAGGMGRVYKARHSALEQVVALKTIRRERFSGDHDESVRRFYREIKAAGAVIHPNVARATDAGEEQGVQFLITEYVDGIDLQKLTEHHGGLPPGAVCELLCQTCAGLAAIQSQGMVHRDIKPSNILTTWDGQAKIVDLGLIRVMEDSVSTDHLTESNALLGTLDFLAPEQAHSAHDIDIRADIYSLGCTLVWLLTGRPLFGPPDYASSAQKIRAHCDVEPDLTEVGRIEAGLVPIARRMLAKAPEDRFSSAADVARALEPFRDSPSLEILLQQSRAGLFEESESPAHNDTISFDYDTTRPSKGTEFWQGKGIRAGAVAFVLAFAVAAVFVIQHGMSSNESGQGELSQPKTAESNGTGNDEGRAGEIPRPNLDTLRPRRAQNVLAHPPTELVWRSEKARTGWHYDVDSEEVTGQCDEIGLLEFGETTSSNYTVHTGLLQIRWVGGIGVFFGAHRDTHQGREVIRFQCLQIQATKIRGVTKFTITRNRGMVPVSSNPDLPFQGELTPVASQRLDGLAGGEQALSFTVNHGRLSHARIGTTDLDALTAPEINDQFSASDYAGGFGAIFDFAEGTFRNARFQRN